MDKPFTPASHIDRARELRVDSTDVEKRLWYRIRDRQIGGYKFRRQHPVGSYILDFACEAAKLGIELDGGQHNQPDRVSADTKRTELLANEGWRVIRFWNHEVIENMGGVLLAIHSALAEEGALTRNHEG